jgi:hypothetical protein
MRSKVDTVLKSAVLFTAMLLLAVGASSAQSVSVGLTAQRTSTILPDGTAVPMWGYACGTVTVPAGSAASCNPLGHSLSGWAPPVITVPTGSNLTINLTNSLPVPTSIFIAGQLGGGLGSAPARSPSPAHTAGQTSTWPITGSGSFTPPPQQDRVRSFGTEVVAVASGNPSATALTWNALKAGTYLLESGTHPSIQGSMGLYGILVVTTAPSGATAGTAYPGVAYDAEVPLLLSEIDPAQNLAVELFLEKVAACPATPGVCASTVSDAAETTVWSGLAGGCGDPNSSTTFHTCYPPVVNYDPRYYLINGAALSRTNLAASAFSPSTSAYINGNLLLRFVNAGLRMHTPSVVGVNGMKLIAEDGNPLPGTPRIQSEVFLAAGKVYDVIVRPTAAGTPLAYTAASLPVFDRALSLSTNNQRDGGMQGFVQVNGGGTLPTAVGAVANPDSYFLNPGVTLTVSDPAKGVIANDINVFGVKVVAFPAHGTVTLNADGTFTYIPTAGTTSDSFVYQANGSGPTALVTLAACTGTCHGGAPTAVNDSYTSNIASRLQIAPPGVLANDSDPQGHPLTASAPTAVTGGTVTLNPDGSFIAVPTTPPTGITTSTVSFNYKAVNSQGTLSASAAVTVTFYGGSGLKVNVYDAPSTAVGNTPAAITDYRWIIEEDRTFVVNPNLVNSAPPCTAPGVPAGCATVPSFGTNFHTSYMPVVAAGCVGTIACESGQTAFDPVSKLHPSVVCDIGNGVCRPGTQQTAVDPGQVHLDPAKRYYISILPGDAGNSFSFGGGAPVPPSTPANPTNNHTTQTRQFSISQDCGLYTDATQAANWAAGSGSCGHGMGGGSIAAAQSTVNVTLEETPFATAKIAVFVFEDDSPLNGENDVHGGTDVQGTNREPGLGGFQIELWDAAGGTGDATGQMTYDMFNYPLSNSLAHTIDPLTLLDACPISSNGDGLVGMIVTCPRYEADGKTVSPLVGQAVIANMMPGRYGVVAHPGADAIARGDEWLQTNTLDGQKAHDSFMKVGGPAYFQEFGPAGYHVSIGFANPKIITARLKPYCDSLATLTPPQACNNTLTGLVTNMHQSRTPDQRLYSTGSRDSLAFTQCYISFGDPDDDDIAFTKCDADGKFTLSGLPPGDWRITLFDQWNDQIVDGLSVPVRLGGGATVNMEIPVQQWHTNVYTSTFFDLNGNGVRDNNEPGLALAPTNIRFRDGSFSNFNNTDLNGYAGFNEIFPLFNWYVLETDTTRYKQTGVHVVYDAGGPVDGNGGGSSSIADHLANTIEPSFGHLPASLHFPGSVYCANADCTDIPTGIKAGPGASSTTPSTGRIDPPWVTTEAWQGYIGEAEFMEFGKTPFAVGENGGIEGEVIYASTRPFDDPALLVHTSWTPDVPGVTINLYQEGTAPDGTQSLKLVDTTVTSSWDAWAQGFRADGNPNMNCPGQDPSSLFLFTLKNSVDWLDLYQHQYQNPPTSPTPLPNNSQYKCYDGLSNFNQVQPAPYDGMYKFPSVTSRNSTTGAPTGTNCTACAANPTGDGTQMLPAGKYVVEVIVPPGYELVKEEDKNILIGDNYIAPVTQQFGGLSNIFILPDQAVVGSLFNANNPQNPSTNFGNFPQTEADTGTVEEKWPCVGQARIVPDYISLFPWSLEVAPFAGATRNLCDRKEIVLEDQRSVRAKFWVFSSTHVAAHFTGIMLDDLSSEFDPFSPQFGEKFAIPNAPISFKDHTGIEISRTYSDQWGLFNGLNYSTWEVNPPNPTGYAPQMMVACMNDPGPIPGPNGTMITDPLYNPNYSQFCYEIPFMPGQTQYMDTPIVPTAAFADGYNLPDCAYPDATPAVASVIGDTSNGGAGPWVLTSGTASRLTINALGDQVVPNNAYSGPSSTTAPFNQKFITRHYGFGATQGTGSVTIGGVTAPVVSWSDAKVVVSVPTTVPSCGATGAPLQRNGTGTAHFAALCGELLITSGNGKQSIDAVTVTVGGKPPTYVAGENASNDALQTALDKATPGDLIIVGPGTYTEMLLMWKPVRLQGVGAASVTVNANTHPSGKIDVWRRKVDCLFGLSLNGGNISTGNPFDPSGGATCAFPAGQPQVDPIPLEPIAGWDANLNGNLAELLQEPSLMGAYEGAAITVLGKGVRGVSVGGVQQYDPNCVANGICTPLTASTTDCNNYPSNFHCNPARIDGMSFIDSSQGGGGIFLHGWNHFTEVSNNRVHSNAGTLSGGITVGQAESPDGTIVGTQMIAFGFDQNVNIHNNSVTQNSSYGDEINSTTTMAAGGVTFCTGSDNYKFNHNWVCGNLSTGDGGGFVHFGLSYNGNISNNSFLFNQTNNITLPTHGGAINIMGAPPDGPVCENSTIDVDCPPSLSDGIGPGLVIDSNLILGNTAESGSGGGIRLQSINGTEVARNAGTPGNWYGVTLTNNIIANNVAGWDGGGISLQDALRVSLINNTVVSNDTTASAGVLFNTLGAPDANTPPPTNGGGNCDPTTNPNCTGNQIVTSTPQAAGLVTMQNTPNMVASLPVTGITCPVNQPSCAIFSNPLLENNLFWNNRAFNIQVGGFGGGPLSQQNLVTLVPQLNQSATGACMTTGVNTSGPTAVTYWDIGVRGDTAASNHASGLKLNPTFSILKDAADYATIPNGYTSAGSSSNNLGSDPALMRQYCNGSRVPPENGGMGYIVPPGISDATTPNPVFNLTPAATVDEGNNWINLAFGPLSLSGPPTSSGQPGITLGNYSIAPASPAVDKAATATSVTHDFFGTHRPQGTGYDIGAVEIVAAGVPVVNVTGISAFGNVAVNTTSTALTLTLHNTGTATFNGISLVFSTARFARATTGGTCGLTLAAGSTCTINVAFSPTALGLANATLTITGTNATVTGSPVNLSGTGVAAVVSATLTPTTWNFTPTSPQIRNCPGVTLAQIQACAADPTHTFTLTNTGNVTLTGITQGVLAGTNASEYTVVGSLSTCGPNGQLATGASCSVRVQFKPLTTQPLGVNGIRNATISVTDAAGTQTSNLTGTAN